MNLVKVSLRSALIFTSSPFRQGFFLPLWRYAHRLLEVQVAAVRLKFPREWGEQGGGVPY